MPRPERPAGPAPGRPQLHEAALRHLSRYATTEAGLVRVLDRRVQRWATAAAAEGADTAADTGTSRAAVREVARALAAAGVVDDAAFAAARAARLARSGRSRRAVAAHLAAKGVAADVAGAVLPDAAQELAAALAYAHRRRIGPFRQAQDADNRHRDMGAMARTGFSRAVAEQVLDMPRRQAEAAVLELKRG